MKNRMNLWCVVAAFALLISMRASSGDGSRFIIDLSGNGGFFDLPYPTELRKTDDGKIDLQKFPKVLGLEMVGRAKQAAADGYGFSTGPTVYFRFAGPVSAEFPDPAKTLEPESSIFIVNVDPDSKDRGKRYPVTATFYKNGPPHIPTARNLLALMPVPGFVLAENTLYAVGALCSLGGVNGGRLPSSPELMAMAEGRAPHGALGRKALDLYGPALEYLASAGIPTADLAALTVFRTGDPTARMVKLFDGVKDREPLEWKTPLQKTGEFPLYTVLSGSVMMPQFQDGTPPYSKGRGGRIHFGEDGLPVVRRYEEVPFVITVPKSSMPESGYPVMIFIHGTAGVSTQVIDRGPIYEDSPESEGHGISTIFFGKSQVAEPGTGPAMVLAHHGIAAFGAAQPQNGERGGQPEMIYFYNFLSPSALRDNILQASAEASIFLRFLRGLEIEGAMVGHDRPVRFDPELVFGMGQSLGSLILGPWGGVETEVKALIPAGNGAYWKLFMAEGNPLDMKSLKRSGLGLTDKILAMDRFHPVIDLLSTVLAPADPFAYQPHYINDPLPGRAPKHVWAAFGLYDHYFYPVAQNAAILCMGLDMAGPPIEPSTKPMLELAGLSILDFPLSGNRSINGTKITAAAAHFKEVGPLDGHHVNYQRDDAKYQYGCFLASYVKTGAPVVYAPRDQWDAECGE